MGEKMWGLAIFASHYAKRRGPTVCAELWRGPLKF